MLHTAPSQNLNRDELLVAYDTAPGAVLATLARALIAYDPVGVLPPGNLDLQALVASATTGFDTTAEMHKLMADPDVAFTGKLMPGIMAGKTPLPGTAGAKAGPTPSPGVYVGGGPLTATLTVAAWLPFVKTSPVQKAYILSDTLSGGPAAGQFALPRPAAVDPSQQAVRAIANATRDGWPTGADAESFCRAAFWLRFQALLSTSYYSGEIETPDGAQRDAYAIVVRAARLAAITRVLLLQLELMPLREMARFLSQPALSSLMLYASADARQTLAELIAKCLSTPVHPWLAAAERLTVPTRRPTEFAASSQTIGLTRDKAFESLRQFTASAGKGGPTDLRDYVLGTLVPTFISGMQKIAWAYDTMRDDDRMQAEAFWGSQQTQAPARVHLWGSAWEALIMSAQQMSPAVIDPIAALCYPRFPLATPQGPSQATGPIAALGYDAVGWGGTGVGQAVGHVASLLPAEAPPPLFVVPQRPEYTPGYALRMLTGTMIRPLTSDEYWGDEDAVRARYEPDDVAKLLGYPSGAAMAAAPAVMATLTHLFSVDPNTQTISKQVPDATEVFISARTRAPWLARFELDGRAMPTRVIAFDEKTPPMERRIKAVVVRTDDYPVLNANTAALADAFVNIAKGALG